jgi:hypothetical protein
MLLFDAHVDVMLLFDAHVSQRQLLRTPEGNAR